MHFLTLKDKRALKAENQKQLHECHSTPLFYLFILPNKCILSVKIINVFWNTSFSKLVFVFVMLKMYLANKTNHTKFIVPDKGGVLGQKPEKVGHLSRQNKMVNLRSFGETNNLPVHALIPQNSLLTPCI